MNEGDAPTGLPILMNFYIRVAPLQPASIPQTGALTSMLIGVKPVPVSAQVCSCLTLRRPVVGGGSNASGLFHPFRDGQCCMYV